MTARQFPVKVDPHLAVKNVAASLFDWLAGYLLAYKHGFFLLAGN